MSDSVRDTPTVADIVLNAMDNKPADAANAMHAVMLDKIRDRIAGKKEELVDMLYNNDESEEDENSEDESDDEFEYEDEEDSDENEEEETDGEDTENAG